MQVDEWIEYSPIFAIGAEFEKACAYTNSFLELRTFLVGYDISIADVVIWAALAGTYYFDPIILPGRLECLICPLSRRPDLIFERHIFCCSSDGRTFNWIESEKLEGSRVLFLQLKFS